MDLNPKFPLTAVDDPVPAQSAVGVCGDGTCDGHNLESKVHRWLTLHPGLRFLSLVVRRIPDGICLEGVLESEEGAPDLEVMLGHLPGVTRVVNNIRIVVPAPAAVYE